MSEASFCTQCGAPAPDGGEFCARCGAQLRVGGAERSIHSGEPRVTARRPSGSETRDSKEMEQLRVPATRIWEESERVTGSSGRTVRKFTPMAAKELIVTDRRVVVVNDSDEVLMQMETDSAVLSDARANVGQIAEISQIPFLGAVEIKQHIFKIRRSRNTSASQQAIGCLAALGMYWFILVALAVAGAISSATHSTVVGVIVFILAIAALRVRPRKTVLLIPLHATPAGSGLLSAIARHLGTPLGWRYEVEVPVSEQQRVLELLTPVALSMREVARQTDKWN